MFAVAQATRYLQSFVGESSDPFEHNEHDWRIRLLWAATNFYSRVYQKVTVSGSCRLPQRGAAIVVCNHTSGLDPVVIQAFCPRLIHWMMAKEYFEHKFLRGIYRTVGAIPVERSGRDMAATRSAVRVLETGNVLGVFPEGKIETDRELIPFQFGIGLLALRTGAPVFPAYLDGSQRGKEMVPVFVARNRIMLSFGPAVELWGLHPSRENIHEATRRIQAAVRVLKQRQNSST